MLNRELYNSYTPIKKDATHCFLTSMRFLKGHFFQSQVMSLALSTEQIDLLWMSHQLFWILNWKIKMDHQMLRQHADYSQDPFCLLKRKRSHWLFNDNTIRGSLCLAVSFHQPGWERAIKFSWLWMLSPRERWVESQPRGTFPMLKVLHSWEHCFPGNNTFTHRAPLGVR